jgi:hypothetical protein
VARQEPLSDPSGTSHDTDRLFTFSSCHERGSGTCHGPFQSFLDTADSKDFKLLLVGERRAGKTSVIHRLHYDSFDPFLSTAAGGGFVAK